MGHIEGILMILKILMDRKIDLGPASTVSLLEILWGL